MDEMTPRYAVTDIAVVAAPADRVWQLLIEELAGAGRWWHTHNVFSARKPIDAVGAVARVRVLPGGAGNPGPQIAYAARTTDVEPRRRLVQTYTGNFRGTGTFTVEPLGEHASRLAFTFDVEPAGWVRQLARVKDVGVEHSATTRAAFKRLAVLATDAADGEPAAVPEATDRVVVTPDGARLHAGDSRPGTDEAVVLVHGWGSNHRAWGTVSGALRAAGRRVVCVDLRGHGWSTAGHDAVTVDRLGADLRFVLDALTIPRATLVCHSGGGLAAVHLASEQPDRVTGLVLLGTAVHDAGASQLETRLMGSPLLTALLRRPALAEKLLRQTMGPARAIPARAEIASALADTAPRTRAAYFRASTGVNLTDRCAAYPGPAVVLRGDEDQVVSGEAVAHTAHLLGTTTRVVPFAGHVLPLEEPAAVLDALTELLAGAVPARREVVTSS